MYLCPPLLIAEPFELRWLLDLMTERSFARQWGRPFGRAPREICPAISTHPHWGGDCTTTMRWQDAGAVLTYGPDVGVTGCGPTVGSPRSSSAPPSLGRNRVVLPPPPEVLRGFLLQFILCKCLFNVILKCKRNVDQSRVTSH